MQRWKTAVLGMAVWVCALSNVAAEPDGSMPTAPTDVRPLLINAEAPAMVLQNASGEPVDLASVLGKRATILVFYRAHW